MTIKQQGGIFGRNPTFNNVTVDGTLAIDQIVEKTGASGISLDGVTLKDGSVVLASGKGIDFSATSGTGTSELFDDYEEGTYTADLYEAGGSTLDTVTGNYTKVGNVVTIHVQSLGGTTGGVGIVRSNLPFTSAHSASNTLAYSFSNGGSVACFVLNNGTFLEFVDTIGSIAAGNKMIGLDVSAASRTYFSLTYITSD